jgi:lysyl-tRNA synthetase class 2
MAEWYRLGFSFEDMIQETCQFLSLFFGEQPISHLSYRDAFATYAGIDYSRATLSSLRQAAINFSIHLPPESANWSRDTYIHLLLSHVVEPCLGNAELTVLRDYPPYEAALARVIEKNGEKVAERFEIYHQGIELTNGYHELSNSQELRERFKEDNIKRASLGKETYSLDEEFLSSIDDMPECCGVSVGFDRALMLRNNLKSISDLLSFSWEPIGTPIFYSNRPA